MTTILKGQFFKEIVATKDSIVEWGWTVLWVESGGDGSGVLGRVVVIRNDMRSASPVWFSYAEVVGKIEGGDWLPANEPKKKLIMPGLMTAPKATPEQVSREEEAILREQNRRMEMIRPAIDLGRSVFFDKPRTDALRASAKKWGLTLVSVRRYLCLYWQFGLRPEGLRPRSKLAGQKSLVERMTRHEQSKGKIPFRAYKTGVRPSKESEPGVVMGVREINLCRKGARTFLFRESPDHALRFTWIRAHLETNNVFFDRKDNPSAPAPTLRQFKRAVKTDPEFARLSHKIIGALPFARNHRQLKNTTRSEVLGPGQIGAIDDMTTKVILVDEFTRMPLGTARVFAVVDVWSKLIVGAHDTLGGSSFAEAMEGLFNAFRDKADFAREQNLDIDLRFVPARGVFATIEADNGPLRGTLADSLPEGLCEISNTTSYRPDMKADVESSFHAYLKQHAETLPGYNRVDRVRGDDNPKFVAYLTTREFRILLWKWIELYNQRQLEGFLPAEVLRSENPPDPTPYQLWNWGVSNCTGLLRHMPDDELRLKLLARGEATMTTRRGIKFKGLVYLYDDGSPEEDALLLKPRRVKVRFDHKYARCIFVEDNGRLLVAKLRSDQDEDYGALTFAEIAKVKTRLDERRRAINRDYRRKQGQLLVHKDEITTEAKKLSEDKFLNEAQRKKVIRDSSVERAREGALQREREEHAAKLENTFDFAREKARATPKPEEKPKKPIVGIRELSAMELLQE